MAGNTSNTGSWVPQVNTVGLRNAGSYKVAGAPWVTGSTLVRNLGTGQGGSTYVGEYKVEFPYITKKIRIKVKGGSMPYVWLRFKSQSDVNGGTPAHPFYDRSFGSAKTPFNVLAWQIGRGDTFEINVGVKELYLYGSQGGSGGTSIFEVVASLTDIPVSRMYELSGEGITTITTSKFL